MLKSFGNRDTERLFGREPARRFPSNLAHVMLRKLVAVDAADALGDLRIPPENRLEKLKRSRTVQYSVRVNDQWRVCFHWKDGNAYDVEIVDYRGLPLRYPV